MLLSELRSLYGNDKFMIAQYNDTYRTVIVPKEVTIKEDLTVWHDGACIINGMHDKDFLHSKQNDLKQELFKLIESDKSLDSITVKYLKTLKRIKKRL